MLRIYCLLVLLLLEASAVAAPVVTAAEGTFAAGSAVTLRGSGFGAKPTAAPLVYDSFEAGTLGAKVLTNRATVGQWDTGAGYDVGVYASDQAWAGAKSVKLSTAGGVYNLSLAKNGSFSTLYMDWHVRIHYQSVPSRNYKPFRLYGANDAMQLNSVILCNGSGMSVEAGGSSSFWWDATGYSQDKWQHYQVALKESSAAGRADGIVKMYIDGVLVSTHTGVVTRSSSAHWDQIRIGHYWASDGVPDCPANAGANIWLDDVFIDTSWARVEIGNAPTYAASSRREIQIPTAWADGTVGITVNPGAFSAGTGAYLYVTDAAGNTNAAGYPVTIGGGAVPPPLPGVPTNLHVQ